MVKLEEALKTVKFSSHKHKASLNLLYTAWWLKTQVSRELKTFDLTHEQFNVLRILKGKHPEAMCVKDVASRMIERNSNVPRIVDRLVAKKFVERSTSQTDKRETQIKLIRGGIEILAVASLKVNNLFSVSVPIEEDEAIQLNMLLEKMRVSE